MTSPIRPPIPCSTACAPWEPETDAVLTIKSIRANKARFLLTSIAVVLGVAFMAGTFVLTDTIKKSYDDMTANVYGDTDALVRSAREADSANQGQTVRGTISASVLDTVAPFPVCRRRGPASRYRGRRRPRRQPARRQREPGHSGALAWQESPALNDGARLRTSPRAPDEIVIDKKSADKGDFALGETVRVISQVGSRSTASPASRRTAADGAAGAGGGVHGGDRVLVIGTPGRYTGVQVVAAPGVAHDQPREQHAVGPQCRRRRGHHW